MELTYDWRSFQTVFYPAKRRTVARSQGESSGPVYVILDQTTVITAYANGEDLSDWIGAAQSEMKTALPNRELITFTREQVDLWMNEALTLPHAYDQIEFLRSKADLKKSGPEMEVPKHFLLDAIQGWWGKVLPSAYGVLIRLDGQAGQDLFMTVRRGRIETFLEPDLSPMGKDRARQAGDVVKYLSEKYLLPVQGVVVPAVEWQEWGDADHPWRKAAASIRANRAKLVPFRWTSATLVATRAFFNV